MTTIRGSAPADLLSRSIRSGAGSLSPQRSKEAGTPLGSIQGKPAGGPASAAEEISAPRHELNRRKRSERRGHSSMALLMENDDVREIGPGRSLIGNPAHCFAEAASTAGAGR